VGVVGDNPFDDYLEDNFLNIKIKNRNVEVMEIKSLDNIYGCNLLFVSRSEKKRLPEIIVLTNKLSILTVADSKGFAEMGVIINMYVVNNEIRFEINEEAAHDSGFEFSYLFLNAAKIINKRKENYEYN